MVAPFSRTLVAKLVEWGTSDAQAVRSEAARLLAALIKHSESEQVQMALISF